MPSLGRCRSVFFSELQNLAILTLHGNSLTGSIADGMSLKEPCLDNPHFELHGMDCRDWGDESESRCETLASSFLTREELRELIENCPRSCQECEDLSWQTGEQPRADASPKCAILRSSREGDSCGHRDGDCFHSCRHGEHGRRWP